MPTNCTPHTRDDICTLPSPIAATVQQTQYGDALGEIEPQARENAFGSGGLPVVKLHCRRFRQGIRFGRHGSAMPIAREIGNGTEVPLGRMATHTTHGKKLARLRRAVSTGRPFGRGAWVQNVANRLGTDPSPRRRGRPTKQGKMICSENTRIE